jgi:hypothetical protein
MSSRASRRLAAAVIDLTLPSDDEDDSYVEPPLTTEDIQFVKQDRADRDANKTYTPECASESSSSSGSDSVSDNDCPDDSSGSSVSSDVASSNESEAPSDAGLPGQSSNMEGSSGFLPSLTGAPLAKRAIQVIDLTDDSETASAKKVKVDP